MDLTRRQLITGALAAMAAAATLRPAPPEPEVLWWLYTTDWVRFDVTDQPDVLVCGYWDPEVGWRIFRGAEAEAEIARQQAIVARGPRFLRQVQS